MKDVLLVSMPFSTAISPSLGLSLLGSGLRQRGFQCDLRYLQLQFARRIGLQSYQQIADGFPSLLLGEWIFAGQLFGDLIPGEDAFVEGVLQHYSAAHGRTLPEALVRGVIEARRLAGAFLDECLQAVDWEAYALVGFTSTFSQHLASLALAKRVKQAFPEKMIIFGGANCEGEMGLETHRQFPFVDFVCSGNGDLLLPALVERLRSGSSCEDLPGLVYRREGQSLANGTVAAPVMDLDGLPYPGFDEYFEQVQASGLPLDSGAFRLMMEFSRGCWWGEKSQCSFCGLNGTMLVYRSKSPQRVIDEVSWLARRYPGVHGINVVDNIFDMRYFRTLVPALAERDLGVSFWQEVKTNLSKQQLQLLKRARMDAIQPGIESLDTQVLQRMHKGCTALQNIQLLKWSRQLGIYVSWNLLSGLPGEDPRAYQRMAAMLPALVHLQPPDSGALSQLRLDRFSAYFNDPGSNGVCNLRPAEPYRYVYPFAGDVLQRLAYYFDFDYADGRQPESYTGVLAQAVGKWRAHADDGALRSYHSNGRTTIYDTRISARKSEIVLEGAAAAIYEFCDAGQTFRSILHYLDEYQPRLAIMPGPPQVQAILDELVANRVMLFLDGHYLSLALPFEQDALSFIDGFAARLAAAAGPARAEAADTQRGLAS